jgi:SAM-dependent methyltransferase
MMTLYSQDDYFSGSEGGYTDYSAQEPALRATFRRLLENLDARHKTGGDLLEIGCGFGYLLDESKPYFQRRVGTDFSAGAVEQARAIGDEVFVGGIESIRKGEAFDCVIATHVIEHVYNPREFVEAILSVLKPGGCMVIAAPDMGSIWRKVMGKRWPSFKLPEHILYFDKRTLPDLMKQCGASEIEPVPYPHAFPLPLIASKVGLGLPASLNRYSLWLPGTTTAFIGVKRG